MPPDSDDTPIYVSTDEEGAPAGAAVSADDLAFSDEDPLYGDGGGGAGGASSMDDDDDDYGGGMAEPVISTRQVRRREREGERRRARGKRSARKKERKKKKGRRREEARGSAAPLVTSRDPRQPTSLAGPTPGLEGGGVPRGAPRGGAPAKPMLSLVITPTPSSACPHAPRRSHAPSLPPSPPLARPSPTPSWTRKP